MPRYRFKNDHNDIEFVMVWPEHIFRQRVKKGVLKTGKKTARLIGVDGVHGFTVIQSPSTYPMRSYACGVSPDQIPEQIAHDRALGLNTEYAPNGDLIFPDRASRKKFCEVNGFFDRNGAGSSDPQKYDPRERDIRGLPRVDMASMREEQGLPPDEYV